MIHPMLPPDDLLRQWENDWHSEREHADVLLINAYTAGARAGADVELAACCGWIEDHGVALNPMSRALRAARRPKPPSLKQQAMELMQTHGAAALKLDPGQCETIRRALEALPND